MGAESDLEGKKTELDPEEPGLGKPQHVLVWIEQGCKKPIKLILKYELKEARITELRWSRQLIEFKCWMCTIIKHALI